MSLEYIRVLSPIQIGNTFIGKDNITLGETKLTSRGLNTPKIAAKIIQDSVVISQDEEANMCDTTLTSNQICAQDFTTTYEDPYATIRTYSNDDSVMNRDIVLPPPYDHYEHLNDSILNDIQQSTMAIVKDTDGNIITNYSMQILVYAGLLLYGTPTLEIQLKNIRINGYVPTKPYIVELYIKRSNKQDMKLVAQLTNDFINSDANLLKPSIRDLIYTSGSNEDTILVVQKFGSVYNIFAKIHVPVFYDSNNKLRTLKFPYNGNDGFLNNLVPVGTFNFIGFKDKEVDTLIRPQILRFTFKTDSIEITIIEENNITNQKDRYIYFNVAVIGVN